MYPPHFLSPPFLCQIGTYSLAVLAKHHNVPFHGVAPVSTIDAECESGANIPIEERPAAEVRGVRDYRWAPADAPCFNPAFDVTPMALVTSHILDTGVYDHAALATLENGFATLAANHKNETNEFCV